MAVYQDKAKERIKSGLRKFRPTLQRALAQKLNESDTRKLVTHMLGQMLGWDIFEDVSGEHRIRGNYADFALKLDGKLFAIIEVKQVDTVLNSKHLYQAVTYAANLPVDWVVLTNGHDWQLYRVIFGKPIDQNLVFKVDLLGQAAKPKEVVEQLYLLSREAQRKDELTAYYEKRTLLSGANIAKVMLTEPMLSTLRTEMRRASGQLVPMDELAQLLVEEVLREDVQSEETARAVRKALASARKQHRVTAEAS